MTQVYLGIEISQRGPIPHSVQFQGEIKNFFDVRIEYVTAAWGTATLPLQLSTG